MGLLRPKLRLIPHLGLPLFHGPHIPWTPAPAVRHSTQRDREGGGRPSETPEVKCAPEDGLEAWPALDFMWGCVSKPTVSPAGLEVVRAQARLSRGTRGMDGAPLLSPGSRLFKAQISW